MTKNTITAGTGKTWPALYAGVSYAGNFKAQIYDDRKLSQIAKDLEDLQKITHRYTAADRNIEDTFTGYTDLIRIERMEDGTVLIVLKKEG